MSGPQTPTGARFALLLEELINQEHEFQVLVRQAATLNPGDVKRMNNHATIYHMAKDSINRLLARELV